ncbi:hypothetical protein A2U01_0101240, partial [Trifolium medium]|nr:hypothetical protein [Trifolium medium]
MIEITCEGAASVLTTTQENIVLV